MGLVPNTAEADGILDVTSTHASLYLFSQLAQPVWLTAGSQTEVTEAIKVWETERKGKKKIQTKRHWKHKIHTVRQKTKLTLF